MTLSTWVQVAEKVLFNRSCFLLHYQSHHTPLLPKGDEMSDKLQHLDDALRDLKAKQAKPLPTPHVGCSVLWYNQGKIEDNNQQAATVTRVEEVGKVTLTIFPPRGVPIHRSGVHWVEHPAMALKASSKSKIHNGLWGYPDNTKARKTHYDKHIQQLDRKIQAVLDEKRMQIDAQRARDAIENGEPMATSTVEPPLPMEPKTEKKTTAAASK
jgi:hypothetical protein